MRFRSHLRGFDVFSEETIQFLNDLKENNRRDWFEAHRDRYNRVMKTPSKWFAESMAAGLSKEYGTHAKAKVFRVNRDLRFAKNKTPYNAHIHISIADGDSGLAWMIGLEPHRLALGYGCLAFSKGQIGAWRHLADRHGAALEAAISGLRLDAPELKRVPAPYPVDHNFSDFLRRKGFCIWLDCVPQKYALGLEGPVQIVAKLEAFSLIREVLAQKLIA